MVLAALLFDEEHRHVTAEALHAQVKSERLRISLATVYNTLRCFQRANLLREIGVDGSRAYFDTNTSEHHHFFVDGQGALIDIAPDRLQLTFIQALTPPCGTDVSRVDVVVRLRASGHAGRRPGGRAHEAPRRDLQHGDHSDADH